jgi:hypothetical protein
LWSLPHTLVVDEGASDDLALNFYSILCDNIKILPSRGLANLSVGIRNRLGKPSPILVDEPIVLLSMASWLVILFVIPRLVIVRGILAYL